MNRLKYDTKEYYLSLMINDIATWVIDEFTPYIPTHPEILSYEGTYLPPFWLEERVIEEFGLLSEFLGEPVPLFVAEYKTLMDVELYTLIETYYTV